MFKVGDVVIYKDRKYGDDKHVVAFYGKASDSPRRTKNPPSIQDIIIVEYASGGYDYAEDVRLLTKLEKVLK